jgi:hypothetical protein
MDTGYKYETKFLSTHLTENIKQDFHIKNLTSKLSGSYYVMQSFQGITSACTLTCTYEYFAKAHSYLSLGILFLGRGVGSGGENYEIS